MPDKVSFITQQSVVPLSPTKQTSVGKRSRTLDSESTQNISFEKMLQDKIAPEGIKFSGHAQARLRTRNIQFTPEQMGRIGEAVDRAASKGARDSLLLVDNIAAVVSVENRTVVTVVDSTSLKDNVFTNIDSTIIA